MERMKSNFFKLLFLCMIPMCLFGQSERLSFEYFPHASNIINSEVSDNEARFSHAVLGRYDIALTEQSSINLNIELLNTGYKSTFNLPDSTSAGGFTITYPETVDYFSFSFLNLGIGHTFKFKRYYISTSAGTGFLLNTTTKTKSKTDLNQNGSTKTYSKPDKIRVTHIPLTASVTRKVAFVGSSFLIGLKGYYSFAASRINQSNKIGFWGAGLVVGFEID